MSITATKPSSTADDKLAAKKAALAAYAASTGIENPERYNSLLEGYSTTEPEVYDQEIRLAAGVERQISEARDNGTFTWDWAADKFGLHFPSKKDNWGQLLKKYPNPYRNKPVYHAEQLMCFVISDLSNKGCSPQAILLAVFYTSFFNPYRGGLHPEFHRVKQALDIDEEEHEELLREIKDARTVITPVRSRKTVSSGWWMRITADAEARIKHWLTTRAAEHLKPTYDPSRRALIKFNLRYTFIRRHSTHLASTILASRIGMTVRGWEPENHSMTFGRLPYMTSWFAKQLNVTKEEAEVVIQELQETGLWDIEEVGEEQYYIRVSQKAAALYEEYYPFVFHTRVSAKRLGFDETQYERKMRGRVGIHKGWIGTSSDWGTVAERDEWLLYPRQFPQAKAWGRNCYPIIIYGIFCPITGRLLYIGQTDGSMRKRLLEHMDRPGVTYSEANGKKMTEHNPLMAAFMRLMFALGLEPNIEMLALAKNKTEAHKLEQYYVEKHEAEGNELFNLIYSKDRPDNRYRKELRLAEKKKKELADSSL